MFHYILSLIPRGSIFMVFRSDKKSCLYTPADVEVQAPEIIDETIVIQNTVVSSLCCHDTWYRTWKNSQARLVWFLNNWLASFIFCSTFNRRLALNDLVVCDFSNIEQLKVHFTTFYWTKRSPLCHLITEVSR